MRTVTQKELRAVDRTLCFDGVHIFRKNCVYIHSGYYVDYKPSSTYIGRFSRPFCQNWPRIAPGWVEECRWPFGDIDRSMSRDELAKEIVCHIAGDGDVGFREPSIGEFLDRIKTTFNGADTPVKYLQSMAYLQILAESYHDANITFGNIINSDSGLIFSDEDKIECRELYRKLIENSAAAKKL
jgi:hypothetical protein